MSKAVLVRELGGPEVLRLVEVDPPPPGPGEAQIAQRAIGVNFIDVYYRSGAYPTALPFTPGLEGAGDVVASARGSRISRSATASPMSARSAAMRRSAMSPPPRWCSCRSRFPTRPARR